MSAASSDRCSSDCKNSRRDRDLQICGRGRAKKFHWRMRDLHEKGARLAPDRCAGATRNEEERRSYKAYAMPRTAASAALLGRRRIHLAGTARLAACGGFPYRNECADDRFTRWKTFPL